MDCLDDNTLAALVDGALGAGQRGEVERHVDRCARCRGMLAALAPWAAGSGPSGDEASGSDHGAVLAKGESVDHFQIVRLLGAGGMGEVYLARDTELGRKVALKVVHPRLFGDQLAASHFRREARAMARLNHRNIVTVYAVGDYLGAPYVAMEYVEGITLREVLEGGRTPLCRLLSIGAGIAAALHAAHEAGVVHRDLKPGNVIVGHDGSVRVLDFGLACLVDVEPDTYAPTMARADDPLGSVKTTLAGTPRYMAPEQWQKLPTSGAADVWALSVLLYQMATGRHPFPAGDMVALARAMCFGQPQALPPDVLPRELARLLGLGLSKEPGARPPAAVMQRALEDAARRTDDGDADATVRIAPSEPDDDVPTEVARPAPAPRVPRSLPEVEPPTEVLQRARPPSRTWLTLALAATIGAAFGALAFATLGTAPARSPSAPPARGAPSAPVADGTTDLDATTSSSAPSPRERQPSGGPRFEPR